MSATITTTPAANTSVPTTDPGHIMTVSLGGKTYKAVAYYTDASGVKTELQFNTDPQTMAKIKALTQGLLDAHEARRVASHTPHVDMKGLIREGLSRADSSIVSHDFAIQPFSLQIAGQMARELSDSRFTFQDSTVKAIDVWNRLEETITRSSSPYTPPPAAAAGSSVTPQPPTPPIAGTNAQAGTPPTVPASPPPSLIRRYSPELDLPGLDFNKADWYETLPIRQKYRIVNDIVEARAPGGRIYEKVWMVFQSRVQQSQQIGQPAGNVSVQVMKLLERERRALKTEVERSLSIISQGIRSKADRIITTFHTLYPEQPVEQLIQEFMQQEFARKEILLRYIYEHAIAEQVRIEDWDHQWAQNHYCDDSHRFVQALARWLDNN